MSDNQQPEASALDMLIDQLPEQFPAAADTIKDDIAPQLIECNPSVRDHYIKVIKKRTNAASIKSVSMLVDEAIKEIDSQATANDSCAEINVTVDPEIVEAAERIAYDPQLFRKKIDIVNRLGVINERRNIGLYQLVMDSRLLPMGSAGSDALAMKNSGHYGAGKSYPLFTCLKLYSQSAYYLISSGSEKSLYSIQNGLKHKALILAEALALESNGRKDNELAYAIRTLVSEGQIKYQTTGYKDKKPVTIVKRIAGPTSLVTTTIKGKLEDQLDDRMISVHPNTSVAQTKDIIERTAQVATGNDMPVDDKELRAYQHYHDSLISAEVVIPFASDIASFVSRNGSLPISARRSFKRVLSAIKTMTLLYQKQREKDEQGRFIADYIDYAVVYQLLKESFEESLGHNKRYTDERVRRIEIEGVMTPKALSERFGVSVAAISQWSSKLVEQGVLNWCEGNGAEFIDEQALEKAKRLGKAYLCVAGCKSLPTPFQLSGDARWDRGCELYTAYDLQLDVCNDDEGRARAVVEKESVETVEQYGDTDSWDKKRAPVKVLSVKSHDDVLKMVENQRKTGSNSSEVINLSSEFDKILSLDQTKIAF